MNEWIQIGISISCGVLIGVVGARLTQRFVGSQKRPEPVRNVAAPVASLVLALGVVAGLMGALAVVQPESLEKLPLVAVGYMPKILIAAIIIILANVASSFGAAGLSQALGRAPIEVQRQAQVALKVTIITLAALLAVNQLGVDTEIVNSAVEAVFFALAASFTLLVGLGGHNVAKEVASTRAIRRLVGEGDSIRVGSVEGLVSTIHPTTVELEKNTGEAIFVPSSKFLNETVTIKRIDLDSHHETD